MINRFPFIFLFYFLTLQYCIGLAIYQHESATGIHMFPILSPPPSSPSAYLSLLIFLLAILIPSCAFSSPAFLMMYSAYKLNKQSDSILPWCTPFRIRNQSVVPCPVLDLHTDFSYYSLDTQITPDVEDLLKGSLHVLLTFIHLSLSMFLHAGTVFPSLFWIFTAPELESVGIVTSVFLFLLNAFSLQYYLWYVRVKRQVTEPYL